MSVKKQHFNFDDLQSFIATFFKVDPSLVSGKTTASDIDNWDSLNHMTFIAAVEAHFEVQFEFGEILAFENVGDLFNVLLHKKSKH